VGSVVVHAACIGQKKKSWGTKSGLRGGQMIRPPLSIHFREIFRSKKSRAAMWNCGRSQPHYVLLEKHFINNPFIQNLIGIKNSSNVSRYAIPFTVLSTKKQRPNIFFSYSTKAIALETVPLYLQSSHADYCNMIGQTECGFVTRHNFVRNSLVALRFWKNIMIILYVWAQIFKHFRFSHMYFSSILTCLFYLTASHSLLNVTWAAVTGRATELFLLQVQPPV
jgi:hypothetical protein